MVHVTPTRDEAVCHLFCDVDWWGEDAPTGKAVQLATEHEASPEHIHAEVEDQVLEALAEALRAERGY
jgi:hypothetical protein